MRARLSRNPNSIGNRRWCLSRTRFGLSAALLGLAVSSCGGDGSAAGGGTPPPVSQPSPSPSPGAVSGSFATEQGVARFLTQATFGPKPAQLDGLVGASDSDWFVAQIGMEPTLARPEYEDYDRRSIGAETEEASLILVAPTAIFWKHAIEAPDQLRLRMAFALSQILVVSDFGGEILADHPQAMIAYQDILRGRAFGNYRDLLEDITFNPAMGEWLTFIGNQKADDSGRVPDENYARELLQLFTVGLVELLPNGEPRLVGGQPVELYDNSDITGLARVFTGLDMQGIDRSRFPILEEALFEQDDLPESFFLPMSYNDTLHSQEEKQFLNCRIAPGTQTLDSIDQALDCIMAHPNVGPFVSRQLIQRFTTSDPDPAYVERVAAAFDAGLATLPDGRTVGEGRKGDLAATLAAILFDDSARRDEDLSDPQFGKVREPVIRFTNWARAFSVDASRPEYALELYDTSDVSWLNQHPHRSRSVFNFYRPGYVAPGTLSGSREMTVPELQIVNATSTTGYINYMTYWAFDGISGQDQDELIDELREQGVPVDEAELARAWRPNYARELSLAGDPTALVDMLDRKLAYSSMSSETKAAIASTVGQIPFDGEEEEDQRLRVSLAVLLVLTSPDFLVQR